MKRNNKILRSLGLVNGDSSSSDEGEDEDDLVSLEKGTNRSVVEEE